MEVGGSLMNLVELGLAASLYIQNFASQKGRFISTSFQCSLLGFYVCGFQANQRDTTGALQVLPLAMMIDSL